MLCYCEKRATWDCATYHCFESDKFVRNSSMSKFAVEMHSICSNFDQFSNWWIPLDCIIILIHLCLHANREKTLCDPTNICPFFSYVWFCCIFVRFHMDLTVMISQKTIWFVSFLRGKGLLAYCSSYAIHSFSDTDLDGWKIPLPHPYVYLLLCRDDAFISKSSA